MTSMSSDMRAKPFLFCEDLKSAKQHLLSAGAETWRLSGSGTVVALCQIKAAALCTASIRDKRNLFQTK